MSGTFFHSQADNRGFEKLCGRDYCGREPALPAFSTDARPLNCVGAVSCLTLLGKVSENLSTATREKLDKI